MKYIPRKNVNWSNEALTWIWPLFFVWKNIRFRSPLNYRPNLVHEPANRRPSFGPKFPRTTWYRPILTQGKRTVDVPDLKPFFPNDLTQRRRRRRGTRGEKNGGPDQARAVRLPEPALLPGHGRRQPLPARRQAPRGPRLLQPPPRSDPPHSSQPICSSSPVAPASWLRRLGSA
jgi:hypothetical protein